MERPTPLRSTSFARTARIVAVALVALVGLAFLAVTLLLPGDRARALVERQLQRSLAREVRLGGASVGLWPPVRLTARGVAVAEPGGFDQGTAVALDALHLDLDVWDLLRRQLTVRSLELDRPAIHLLVRPDGSTNLDSLARPGPERRRETPLDLDVRAASIRDARVLLDDRRARRRVSFVLGSRLGFSSRAGRIATKGTTTIADLAHGPMSAARMTELSHGLAGLTWTVEHDGVFDPARRRLALTRLDLRFGGTRLGLSGVVDEPGARARYDLRTRGERVDLGSLIGFLAEAQAQALHGLRGHGRLDFDLAIQGGLAAGATPRANGWLRVTGARLQYPEAPAAIENLSLTARLAPDSIGIGDLACRVGGQPVQAMFVAERLRDPRVRFRVRGNVDLEAVAPLIARPGTELGGKVALDVQGQGPAKDPGALALQGQARLERVRVVAPEIPKPLEEIRGTLSFSQRRAGARALTLKAGATSVAIDADIERPLALLAPPERRAGSAAGDRPPIPPARVRFSLASPFLDVDDVFRQGTGPLALVNAEGGGTVRIARLKKQRFEVKNVRADVALEPDVLAVREFRLHAYGGALTGNARLDGRDRERPRAVAEVRADSLDAELLTAAFSKAPWARGALGGTLQLAAVLADPRGTLSADGLATVADGALRSLPVLEKLAALTKSEAFKAIPFDDLRGTVRVRQGRVFTGPVRIAGRNTDWDLSGWVGFDGALDYAASVTIPQEAVARLGSRAALAAGALADAQGRVLLDLRVTGTLKDPKIGIDEAATRARLAGRVSTALEEQQQKLLGQQKALEDSIAARGAALEDSVRATARRRARALEDSLRKKAGGIFQKLLGGARDTTP